ncbi:MAG: hypothetical protein ACKOCX_04335 [Planctomycetota bacterium]
MAGSFNIFRRYQKAALAALAIMAMLAFFVLPPILQMGASGPTASDDVVVTWQGGRLLESGLQREVIARRALNQFLMALQAAASGSDRVQPPLPDDEKSVVDSMLMAREARANGLEVSDTVVNDFLAIWTGDRVKPEQIEGVIDQLRSRAGITEQDIFDGLRTLLLGERMQALALRGTGFAGSPPGWRWDAFRRLEQSATVEVVPVIVESLGGEVPEPAPAALEKLYDQYRDDLPRARAKTPGFREPARLRYDALVATPDLFVAEAEKDVTDEQIEKFYADNKDALFKKVEPAKEPGAEDAKAGDATPAAPEQPAAEGKPAEKPAEPAAPAADKPAGDKPAGASPAPAAAPGQNGSLRGRSPIRPVRFRQPAAAAPAATPPAAAAPAADAAKPGPAGEAKQETPPADAAGGAQQAETSAKPDAAAESAHEPLDKVRDDIRKRLAREAADRKVGEAFDKVAARIATYADDVELAIGMGEPIPQAPDVDKLAAEHGLQAIRSDFVDAGEAIAGGGIGSSFQLTFSQQGGVRQQQWADMLFSPEAARWRPVATRDFAGNRYLSWKTEDRPEFTPPLAEVREDVERVWRLMEARPVAKRRALEIAGAAAGKTLAEAVAGREGVEVATVGPFTWLTRGTAPFGSAPTISQPDGVQMPGEEFMRSVFALQPGEAAVAFNEPETICYAIRLVSFEPAEETLRERFVDASADPRRLAMLAEDETRDVRNRWVEGIEKRYGVQWKRDPR